MNYHRPSSLAEAVDLLAAAQDASVLAGGQSLLAAMRLGLSAPSDLVDLQSIGELQTIDVQGDFLKVGAMVPHARIAAHPQVTAKWRALSDLAADIADPQIRAVGTIGGSLANNDPSACWPAGVLACDARLVTTRRTITADEFFRGIFTTALEHGELLTAIVFPTLTRARYLKFEQQASRFALVGVAVAQQLTGEVRVAITGLGQGVFRWREAEAALQERFSVDALDGLALDPALATDDVHADAVYRAHLGAVLLRRAVKSIVE